MVHVYELDKHTGAYAPAGAAPKQLKGWCAGSTEPGNVFVMFFQRPIYE